MTTPVKNSKKADKPFDSEIYKKVGRLILLPLISAFKAMDKLVNCCSSAREIGSDLNKFVEELHEAFRGTEVSETLNIHVALKHIKHILHFLVKQGLGLCKK